MTDLKLFFKKNKIERENVEYVATESLRDENGNPLKWIIKPLKTVQAEAIREECTIDVPVTGKMGMYRPKFNNKKYIAKLITTAVVYPDLNDVELQESYGVMGAEQLIVEILDNPSEYNRLVEFVSDMIIGKDINTEVKEAKN